MLIENDRMLGSYFKYMANNMMDTAQEQETLTSADVKEFLRSKQKPFLQALYKFALKSGRGFAQYKINEEGLVIEKISSTEGNPEAEFNLNGLCNVASRAMALALKNIFRDQIEVNLVMTNTTDTDTIPRSQLREYHIDPRWLKGHEFLRYRVNGEESFVSVDATLKQFQRKVNLKQYLLIFPSFVEEFVYPHFYPMEGRSKTHDVEQFQESLERDIAIGKYGNATMDDFYELVRAIVE
jgi:hypothetical protein